MLESYMGTNNSSSPYPPALKHIHCPNPTPSSCQSFLSPQHPAGIHSCTQNSCNDMLLLYLAK